MDFLQSMAELPGKLDRIEELIAANTKALSEATEQLGNTRIYEHDAAKYMGVDLSTMYRHRQRGLTYEKVGRIISYLRKDLDAWRTAGRVRVS